MRPRPADTPSVTPVALPYDSFVFRDREGVEIDVLTWATFFEDLNYRVLKDELVVPTTLHVRTVWQGIDDVVGCMFATGVDRVDPSGCWSGFATIAETSTEDQALGIHDRVVTAIQSSGLPMTSSNTLWKACELYKWLEPT